MPEGIAASQNVSPLRLRVNAGPSRLLPGQAEIPQYPAGRTAGFVAGNLRAAPLG